MARYQPKAKDTNSLLAFFFLMLYITAVLIRPHEMFQATLEWTLIKFLAILCLIMTLIAQRPLKLYPQHWMLFFLAPLIIVSGFVNGSGMWGVSQANGFIATSLIPLFLVSNCISNIKYQHLIMAICLLAALIIIHNGHTQQSSLLWDGWARGTQAVNNFGSENRRITYLGFFNDPNDIGMFLVMNIPFTVYFFNRGKFLTKAIMLMTLATLLYGVYITYSRGTALGVVALICIYYLVVKAGSRTFLAAILFAPVGIVILTFLQRNVDESASGRLEAWYEGIQMLKSYPLGVGKGAFIDHHIRTAHNSYVLVAGELGFIGYSLWGGALIFTVLSGYFFIKNSLKLNIELSTEAKAELSVNKTLFFSMTGFIVTSFFLSRSYTVLLFIFLGMTLASHHRLVKLIPELKQYFTASLALRSMLYSWSILLTVYLALKLAL